MLSNKFVINHVNNEIHSIKIEKQFFVIQEANKFKICADQFEKDMLLFYSFLVNVPLWYTLKTSENLWFSFVFRGYEMKKFAREGVRLMNGILEIARSQLSHFITPQSTRKPCFHGVQDGNIDQK